MDERIVDRLARRHLISLRTGCFCNPGVGEAAFRVTGKDAPDLSVEGGGVTVDEYIDAIGLESGGAIRVSLGLVSNAPDVGRFLEFAERFRDVVPTGAALPPREGC